MAVGRNDPCPCGSGKKYKKCCGDIARGHQLSAQNELRFERIPPSMPCPCRSGQPFGNCHGAHMGKPPDTPPPTDFVSSVKTRPGATPVSLKHLIESAIKYLFSPNESGLHLGQPRGESCATVAMHTQRLLSKYGIAARVVAGAARWRDYPVGYAWGGQDEYHMWVETEFGEVVDLACDDLNSRLKDPSMPLHIQAPRNAWDVPSVLSDRGYVEIIGGHAQINVDVPGEAAFDRIAEVLTRYCEEHEGELRLEFPSSD